MNSLQKQNHSPNISFQESYLVTFENMVSKIENVVEAELLFKKLQFLGLNFDPFQEEIGDECKQIMDQLGITEQIQNPYLFTNLLLRLLDRTEEKLNNLKQ